MQTHPIISAKASRMDLAFENEKWKELLKKKREEC
jgi:hypothetical protein